LRRRLAVGKRYSRRRPRRERQNVRQLVALVRYWPGPGGGKVLQKKRGVLALEAARGRARFRWFRTSHPPHGTHTRFAAGLKRLLISVCIRSMAVI